MARALLAALHPELAGIRQPLAGEFSGSSGPSSAAISPRRSTSRRSAAVLAAVTSRLRREGRLAGDGGAREQLAERPPLAALRAVEGAGMAASG